eukprot:6195820-Pleurochrysis_carterae.AAC.3
MCALLRLLSGGPGLTFALLVDGGHTSKKTFDLAVRMCAEGDSLRVVHIARPQSEDEVEAARYFEGECDKLDAIQVCCMLKDCHPFESAGLGSFGDRGTGKGGHSGRRSRS